MEVVVEILADGHARDLLGRLPPFAIAAPSDLAAGAIVHADAATGHLLAVLAGAGTARAEVYRLAAGEGLDPLHPARRSSRPRPSSPRRGLTTRASPRSKCCRSSPPMATRAAISTKRFTSSGWPTRRALFAEALVRGASFHLRASSCRCCRASSPRGSPASNPDVPRPALVFRLVVDREGAVCDVAILRARIRSQRKLSFHAVQRFLDGTDRALADTAFAGASRHGSRGGPRAPMVSRAERAGGAERRLSC